MTTENDEDIGYPADVDSIAMILNRDDDYHNPYGATEFIHLPSMNILTSQPSHADCQTGDMRMSDSIVRVLLHHARDELMKIKAPSHAERHRRFRAYKDGKLIEALRDPSLYAQHTPGASIGREAKESQAGANLVHGFNDAIQAAGYEIAAIILAEAECKAALFAESILDDLVCAYHGGHRLAEAYNAMSVVQREASEFPGEPDDENDDEENFSLWSPILSRHLEAQTSVQHSPAAFESLVWGFVWHVDVNT